MVNFPKDARKNILWWLFVSGLTTVSVRLTKNNPSAADDDVVLADLHSGNEANFTSYVAQTLNPTGTPDLDGSNRGRTVSGTVTFTGSAGSSNEIYGYYLTITVSGTTYLVGWRRLATPILMGGEAGTFTRVITVLCDQFVP